MKGATLCMLSWTPSTLLKSLKLAVKRYDKVIETTTDTTDRLLEIDDNESSKPRDARATDSKRGEG